MDTFLLIVCLSMVAIAAANGGYNYQQPRPGIGQNFRPSAPFGSNAAPSGPQYAPQQNGPAPQYFQQQSVGPSQGYIPPISQHISLPAQYGGSFQQPSAYGPSAPAASGPQYNGQQQQQQQPQQQQRQTILTNTIYIHSAPDEIEEFTPDQPEADPIRKNYRILFIRAPTHNVRINSVKQSQAANEEKTIIYVLTKKPEIVKIDSQSVQAVQKPQKPEVYFIKYKTQEEANRAQQEIQAQYDALGGSTSISDEGFAPITSVIGGGPINGGSIGAGGSGSSSVGGSFNDPSFSSGSNFAQSVSSNFQQSFQSNRVSSAGSSNFGVSSPSLGYLPVKTNKK